MKDVLGKDRALRSVAVSPGEDDHRREPCRPDATNCLLKHRQLWLCVLMKDLAVGADVAKRISSNGGCGVIGALRPVAICPLGNVWRQHSREGGAAMKGAVKTMAILLELGRAIGSTAGLD